MVSTPLRVALLALVLAPGCAARDAASAQNGGDPDREEAAAIAADAEAMIHRPSAGPGDESSGARSAPSSGPVEQPSPIVLWCADDKGEACRRVAQELDVPVTAVEQIQRVMLTSIQDLADDCADPQIQSLARRLSESLSLPWERWHSHVGAVLLPEHIRDIYDGAGCLNCCVGQLPSIKIHTVETSVEPMYLVRVWERGQN